MSIRSILRKSAAPRANTTNARSSIKAPVESSAARSSSSAAHSTNAGVKRKGSAASELSTNSFSALPDAERVNSLNLQMNRNYKRMHSLSKRINAERTAPQNPAYEIVTLDAKNQNLVCAGRTFAFKMFKGPGDAKTLKGLASSEARNEIVEYVNRRGAFFETYNCVFIDARESLLWDIVQEGQNKSLQQNSSVGPETPQTKHQYVSIPLEYIVTATGLPDKPKLLRVAGNGAHSSSGSPCRLDR